MGAITTQRECRKGCPSSGSRRYHGPFVYLEVARAVLALVLVLDARADREPGHLERVAGADRLEDLAAGGEDPHRHEVALLRALAHGFLALVVEDLPQLVDDLGRRAVAADPRDRLVLEADHRRVRVVLGRGSRLHQLARVVLVVLPELIDLALELGPQVLRDDAVRLDLEQIVEERDGALVVAVRRPLGVGAGQALAEIEVLRARVEGLAERGDLAVGVAESPRQVGALDVELALLDVVARLLLLVERVLGDLGVAARERELAPALVDPQGALVVGEGRLVESLERLAIALGLDPAHARAAHRGEVLAVRLNVGEDLLGLVVPVELHESGEEPDPRPVVGGRVGNRLLETGETLLGLVVLELVLGQTPPRARVVGIDGESLLVRPLGLDPALLLGEVIGLLGDLGGEDPEPRGVLEHLGSGIGDVLHDLLGVAVGSLRDDESRAARIGAEALHDVVGFLAAAGLDVRVREERLLVRDGRAAALAAVLGGLGRDRLERPGRAHRLLGVGVGVDVVEHALLLDLDVGESQAVAAREPQRERARPLAGLEDDPVPALVEVAVDPHARVETLAVAIDGPDERAVEEQLGRAALVGERHVALARRLDVRHEVARAVGRAERSGKVDRRRVPARRNLDPAEVALRRRVVSLRVHGLQANVHLGREHLVEDRAPRVPEGSHDLPVPEVAPALRDVERALGVAVGEAKLLQPGVVVVERPAVLRGGRGARDLLEGLVDPLATVGHAVPQPREGVDRQDAAGVVGTLGDRLEQVVELGGDVAPRLARERDDLGALKSRCGRRRGRRRGRLVLSERARAGRDQEEQSEKRGGESPSVGGHDYSSPPSLVRITRSFSARSMSPTNLRNSSYRSFGIRFVFTSNLRTIWSFPPSSLKVLL